MIDQDGNAPGMRYLKAPLKGGHVNFFPSCFTLQRLRCSPLSLRDFPLRSLEPYTLFLPSLFVFSPFETLRPPDFRPLMFSKPSVFVLFGLATSALATVYVRPIHFFEVSLV